MVIDLGFCLDLLTSSGLKAVQAAYDDLRSATLQELKNDMPAILARLGMDSAYDNAQVMEELLNKMMPKNSGGGDLLLRRLDYAVINHLHVIRSKASFDEPFGSVRGVFIEGAPLYENSGFREKTHIQICVRNSALIKGVFRVPDSELH